MTQTIEQKACLPDTSTAAGYKGWHDKCWTELDPKIRARAMFYLRKDFSKELLDQIRDLYSKDPIYWATPFHFGQGMGIRNDLRKNVALDNELPTGNWDDYYVAAMECAAGVRAF